MIDLSPVPRDRHLKTSISLPADLQERARRVAKEHGLSLSEYVRRVVRADLDERDRRPL